MTEPHPSVPDRPYLRGRLGRDHALGVDWFAIVVRAVSAVVGGVAGLVWLWCAFMVLVSRLSTDPASDPHGFGVMFGLVFGIPAGVVCWGVLPASLSHGLRAPSRRILAITYVVGLILQALTLVVC